MVKLEVGEFIIGVGEVVLIHRFDLGVGWFLILITATMKHGE